MQFSNHWFSGRVDSTKKNVVFRFGTIFFPTSFRCKILPFVRQKYDKKTRGWVCRSFPWWGCWSITNGCNTGVIHSFSWQLAADGCMVEKSCEALVGRRKFWRHNNEGAFIHMISLCMLCLFLFGIYICFWCAIMPWTVCIMPHVPEKLLCEKCTYVYDRIGSNLESAVKM